MTAIDPPRNQDDYPDRDVDCEQALEPALHVLLADAYACGWSPAEARRAMRKLLLAHRMTDVENAKVEAALAILRAAERARTR
jgi:hypothetical protein